MTGKISIVIPACNAENTVKQCLESIYSQNSADFEVIVVDDCSSDGTLEKIREFPCRVIDLKKRSGASAARNEGVKQSAGEIIFFLDADVVLHKGALERIRVSFEKHPEADAVQGIYTREIDFDDPASLARNYYKYHKTHRITGDYIFGVNSYCFAVRRRAFKSIGGFDPKADGVEDVELGMRMQEKGCRILLDKELQVRHCKRYTLFGLLKTDYRKVRAKTKLLLNAHLRKKGPLKMNRGKVTFSLNRGKDMVPEFLSVLLPSLIIAAFTAFAVAGNLIFLYSGLGMVLMFVLLNLGFLRLIGKNKGVFVQAGCLLVYFFEMLTALAAAVTAVCGCLGFEKTRWARKIILHDKSVLPEQITVFVTDRCNLKCAHCFYRASLNKAGDEFSVEELKKIAPTIGRFSFLSLTGGEPFLRDDLAEIAGVFMRENGVSRISIPTNGFLTEKIVDTTRRILEISGKTRIIVKVSLDGIGGEHDRIRGVSGSFEKVMETFIQLKKLKEEYPNFRTGVLLTLSKLNEYELWKTHQYVTDRLSPDVIGLNFVRGDVKISSLKDVDLDNYRRLYSHILQDLRRSDHHEFYSAYKSGISKLVCEIVRKKEYPLECYAGSLSAVIDSSLNVFPCENLKRKMGNLRDYGYSFKNLWSSEDSRRTREYIANDGCYCTCECNLQINSFFNIKRLLPLTAKTLGYRVRGKVGVNP